MNYYQPHFNRTLLYANDHFEVDFKTKVLTSVCYLNSYKKVYLNAVCILYHFKVIKTFRD